MDRTGIRVCASLSVLGLLVRPKYARWMRVASAQQVRRAIRAVAQLGRALRSGRRGRGFKSHQPDHLPLVYHVYVLRSQKNGRRYVGSCSDLERRLSEHNAGYSKATKHGTPWKLIHSEHLPNRADAIRRERYYKSGRGRDDLDRIR